MGNAKVIDPFEGYTMQELVELDEKSFRGYQVHMNNKLANNQAAICRDIKEIKKRLNKRPEVVRATIALICTIVTAVIAGAALIVALSG